MSVFYLDFENGNDSTTDTPLGWWSVAFTNGSGTEPVADETVTGGSSGSTAKVTVVTTSSGTWGGSDAAGTMYFYGKSAAFQSETVNGASCSFSIGGDFTYCAWKTLNSGATGARLNPSDEVRFFKGNNPSVTSIGNATWTKSSRVITLASAQTLMIDDCESGWTNAGNDIATLTYMSAGSTGCSYGSYSLDLTFDATPQANTLQAYKTITQTDFSSYQKITFFVSFYSSGWANNNLTICLCSDTAGATVVDSFPITEASWAGSFTSATFTLARTGGGNLGSSIQSVAIYTGSVAPAASLRVMFDNINACTTNGLCLGCLISKSSSEEWSSEGWYTVNAIGGTDVRIGGLGANVNEWNNRGYHTTGTSPDTVTTYIRHGIPTKYHTSTESPYFALQESGSSTNGYVTYSGGWNRNTNVQDGMTIFNLHAKSGYGFYMSSRGYVKLDRLGIIGGYRAFYVSNAFRNQYTNLLSVGGNIAFDVSSSNESSNLYYNNVWVGCSFQSPMNIGTRHSVYDNCYFICSVSNAAYGLSNSDLFKNCVIAQHNSGLYFTQGQDTMIKDCIFDNTYSGNDILVELGANLYNCSGVTLGTPDMAGGFVRSHKHNQTTQYRTNTYGGDIYEETTNRHTASGFAWGVDVTNTSTVNSSYPIKLPLGKVGCLANTTYTFKAWVKKTHATTISAQLVAVGGYINGVSANVTDLKADDTNWEELSVSFTPTENGWVDVEVWVWSTSNIQSVYIDDISITSA